MAMTAPSAGPSLAEPGPAESADGRTERGLRTRQRIVEAVLQLIGAGNLAPTAEEVARHAGVGYRTVFRHFLDMESLFDELNARIRTLVEEGLSAPPAEGGLEARIAALVDRRAATFESISLFYLSGDIRLHGSPTLRRTRAQFARLLRTQLHGHLPEAGRSSDLLELADLIASVDGWLRLRRTQGLSPQAAAAAVKTGLLTLLEPSQV